MEQAPPSSAPPFFDGSNYAYWKVRMRAHLKSRTDNVWLAIGTGWTRLEGVCDTWSKEVCAKSDCNNKEINTIFMVVSYDEFQRISNCETAKDVLRLSMRIPKALKRNKL